MCSLCIRHQRPAFSRHGGDCSAAGVPLGRHLEAHIRHPGVVGLTTSADRQRIDAVLRRAVRADLWPSAVTSEPPTFGDLCSTADDELFYKIVTNSNHILHTLLPSLSTAPQHYTLRRRTHSLQLPGHHTHLSDCNFIQGGPKSKPLRHDQKSY